MNTTDPNDEDSADCAVCGLSLEDHEPRDETHPGIHEKCSIEDYRNPIQQIKDSYVNGQLKQCRDWINQIGLQDFILEARAEDEISDSMLIEILGSYAQ